jgi:hypothetical protein
MRRVVNLRSNLPTVKPTVAMIGNKLRVQQRPSMYCKV